MPGHAGDVAHAEVNSTLRTVLATGRLYVVRTWFLAVIQSAASSDANEIALVTA